MSNPLIALRDAGVSVWVDSLSREMIRTGQLKRWIAEDGLRGQTSNPTIFQGAISKGRDYDEQSKELAATGMEAEPLAWELMISDVQAAADIWKPVYDQTEGRDGFVSLELHPGYATDPDKSLAQARDLWKRVGRDNLMIKVPATRECLPVIEQLLYEGLNINITLLFAQQRYGQVIEAYLKAMERRHAEHKPLAGIASVASFFVSRVDTEAEKRFDKVLAEKGTLRQRIDALRGKVAVANARVAYRMFQRKFAGPRWEALEKAGARVQRPLWASTSTKNPAYADTLYVHELIGPHCVNTMPIETIDAFRDHGRVEPTLTDAHIDQAEALLRELAEVGVDLDDMCLNTLVNEGVKKFFDSYQQLIEAVASNVRQLQHAS